MAAAVESATRGGDPVEEQAVVRRYGFAVPTTAALAMIEKYSPSGTVEVGAGTGYWAAQLAARGVDVVAYDLHPPPAPASRWFAGSTPWFPVRQADEHIVSDHVGRSLLLVWPTRDEMWAADAIRLYHGGGGECLLYVGEPPGGRTGDAVFHALTGATEGCIACTYGVVDSACTCDLRPLWRCVDVLGLPAWQASDVRLHVLRRAEGGRRRLATRWFRQR
jgi:hypothetical protein